MALIPLPGDNSLVPSGWVQHPDGSWGPPAGAGTSGSGTGSALVGPGPAGGVSQGTTLNSVNLDDIIPPNQRPAPQGKAVGPWTNPFTDAYINPETGQPEMLTPGGGGFNPLSMLGGGNPYWRAILAGAGILAPTPAETGELPRQTLGRSPGGYPAPPQHPPSVGMMPHQWQKPPEINTPVQGVGGFPGTWQSPGQQLAPSDTSTSPPAVSSRAGGGGARPRGAGAGAGAGRARIDPAAVNLGHYVPTTGAARNPTFVPLAATPGVTRLMGGNPITTADWSGLFQRRPPPKGALANG